MITLKLTKLVAVRSICWLCKESIVPDTLHVLINFDEEGHVSTRTRAHMYCSDDFADGFQSEITRRNAAELKERDNPPTPGEKKE